MKTLAKVVKDCIAPSGSSRTLVALRLVTVGLLAAQAVLLVGTLLEFWDDRELLAWKALPVDGTLQAPTLAGAAAVLTGLGLGAGLSAALVAATFVVSVGLLLVLWRTTFVSLLSWLKRDALKDTAECAKNFVAKPASPRPLAAMRIGVAAVLLAQCFMLAGNLLELFGDRGLVQWKMLPFQPPPEIPSIGTVSNVLGQFGIGPDTAVRVVFFTYVGSLVLLLLGWQTRFAAIVAWLTQMALKSTGSTAIYGVDEFAHIALFYCVWMPVGYAWSLDARAGVVSDVPTPLARLSLRVLQLHMCIVYLSSGIEKASGEQWWNGEAVWRSIMRPDFATFDLSWIADFQWLAVVLCVGTLVVEIGYAFLIWNRWTRPVWAVQTIALHVGIAVFLGLWTFGALMIALNVAAVVISPDPPRRKAVVVQSRQRKAAELLAV